MKDMKSLESTLVYKHLNNGDRITKMVHRSLQEGRILKKEDLEEAFLIINKNFKFTLKYKVLDAFAKGDIVLLFSPKDVRLPTCLPFFLTKNNNRAVAVVLVDMYGHENQSNGNVEIDAKKLYTMMEGAYNALMYYHYHYSLGKRNVIITSGSAIYANMFARVLNKKYALNTDTAKSAKVTFLTSKFFMINVLGMADGDIVTNYAMKNAINANPVLLRELDEAVPEDAYKNLGTFLAVLEGHEYGIRLGGLTVRGFMERFIEMYDASALLSLEHFVYFMYTVSSVLNGAYINNQHILEDIVEKDGFKIYNDMTRLESN